MVGHDRDDEDRRRRQLALKRGPRAAAHPVVVSVNTGTERRLAGSHDRRRGAGEVVTPDGTGADHGAHVASEVTRMMAGGDAAKRPRRGDVDEIEVGEARERRARGAAGASMCRRRRPPECSRR
jgi:hypothetical protein